MPKIGSIGIPELLIILVVVLLIFGPRRLPDMAKGLGQSVREFRKGLRDMRKEFDDEASPDAANAPVGGATAAAASVNQASVSQAAAGQPEVPAEPGVPHAAPRVPVATNPADGDADVERRA